MTEGTELIVQELKSCCFVYSRRQCNDKSSNRTSATKLKIISRMMKLLLY